MSRQIDQLRILSFESRRAAEMRSLIERHGGRASVVPSMRERPLDENSAALNFAESLFAGEIDIVVFLTGVGAQILRDAVETRYDGQRFLAALDHCSIFVRGPKPARLLRAWNVHIDRQAPEPNTWRELLTVIDAEFKIAGQTVAVQEYGRPNEEFYAALRDRGAEVLPIPVYRWTLPEETAPLEQAIRDTIADHFDVLMFTSAFQLTAVLDVAESLGLRKVWLAAAACCVIASIGPTASEALAEIGLTVDLESSPPKMGQLVRLASEQAPRLLKEKFSDGDSSRSSDSDS